MPQLSTRDYRKILEFCGVLYASLDPELLVRNAIAGLRELVPCEAITYNEMHPAENVSRDLDVPGGVLGIANWPHVMGDHPVLTHILATGDGTAHKLSDFVTRRQLRETGLYSEVYRAAGVESGLCVALSITSSPRPVVIGMGLHRGKVDFSERDRLVMNLIRPHLVRAYENARAAAQLGQALDDQACGIVGLDTRGRVRFLTRRAGAWLAEYLGWSPSPGDRLAEPLDTWRSRLLSSGSRASVPSPREPLVLERGARRLRVRLLEGAEPMLHIEELSDSIPAGPLRRLGLTAREADVLVWMAAGKANGDIGRILGVSRRTVEKHCERIYQKLGVETRAAAARRALDATQRLAP